VLTGTLPLEAGMLMGGHVNIHDGSASQFAKSQMHNYSRRMILSMSPSGNHVSDSTVPS